MHYPPSDDASVKSSISGDPPSEPASELTDVLERISDGFFAVDHQWRISYVNRRIEALLSIERDDYLHRSLWERFPTLLGTVFEEQFHQAIEQKTTQTFGWFSPMFQLWFEITVYPSPTGLSVFLRDITAQKEAEAALHLSNERFRLAANADAIYDWDIQTDHLFWGEGLQEVFCYTSDELQMPAWKAAIHPGEREEVLSDLVRTLNDPLVTVWKKEYRIRKKDGKFCFVYDRGHILRDESGRAVRMVGLMQNITERKLLEQELEEQRKQTLAAVMHAQEEERSQIGRELHDNINQVLTTVKLYQELILSGVSNHDELVKKSAQLLQQSIDEIRYVSRRLSAPTLGQMKLGDSVKELLDFVRSTHQFTVVEETVVLHNLHISNELHLAVYRILQEQLTNVLRHAEASLIRVSFAFVDGCLVVTIADNGRGFDPQKKQKGIGVTNMKIRAEGLKGTLTIDSAPGRGCTLVATFPLAF
jgi:PAS domain S-box-containing protein